MVSENKSVALSVRESVFSRMPTMMPQENDLLHKQNELLRSSEAAYQKEAQLLREELSNARGINDLTADETTKLLLDNSRLQQAVVAARSEVLHKDEMLRLLSAEINELSAKLEWYATAAAGLGIEASWDQSLAAEASNSSAHGTALVSHPLVGAEAQTPQMSQGGAEPAAADSQEGSSAEAVQQVMNSSGGFPAAPPANGHLGRKSGGRNGSEAPAAGSAEAAVEALVTALPLRLSTQGVIRISTERRGTFSGQPITPRDISELKQKLEQEGSKTARQRAAAKQQAKEGSAGGAAALPPLPTPPGSSGGAAAAAAAANALLAAAAASSAATAAPHQQHEKQPQPEMQVAADGPAEGELDDVEMLQGSPNLAESLKRCLVRESTPNLLLTPPEPTISPAITTAITPAGLDRQAVDSQAAVASDTGSLKVITSKQPAGGAVSAAVGAAAATAAASSAASTPKAAGIQPRHSPSKPVSPLVAAVPAVNEFKLAARVAPPPEITCPDSSAAAATAAPAAAPVELSELQPGIPQRQQALARLAAEQQQVSAARAAAAAAARSAGGASTTAGSGGPAISEPSPRSNLAVAMVNPVALVAAAAAAGVIDEPAAAAMAATAAAEQAATAAAAVPLCQRQAALVRLAVEQDARIQQQEHQPSARSRSNSPAGREPSQRRAAVTRLGIAGQNELDNVSAAAAADANGVAVESVPDSKAAAATAAVAATADSCSSSSGGGGSAPPKDDAEGGPGSPGGSNSGAADKPAANSTTTQAKTSHGGSSTGNQSSSTPAGKQQQSQGTGPTAGSKVDTETKQQEQPKEQETTTAEPKPVAAAASAASDAGCAAPAAAAAPSFLAAVRVKADGGELSRSNSLKDRIAAMNAANQQQQSPHGSPKSPFGGRPSSGGGSKAVMSRFVSAQQEPGAEKAAAAAAAPSKIPQQPAEAPAASSMSSRSSGGSNSSKMSVKIAAKVPSKIPSVSVSPKSADASAATTPTAATIDTPNHQATGSGSSSARASSVGGAVDGQVQIRLVPAVDAAAAQAKDSSTTTSVDKSPKAGGNKGAAKAAKAASGELQQSRNAASSECAGNSKAAAAATVADAVLENSTGMGVKIAAVRRISTSGGGVDDTVERDGTDAAATATPPKRQLSNRMAAMRAAFEGK